MITIQKNKFVIAIDPKVEEEERISTFLQSKRYVAVINMHSIFPKFHKIKELVGNYDFVKYFYGGSLAFYQEMIGNFTIKRGKVVYMGKYFDSSVI